MTDQISSPLAEAVPNSLDEFLTRDPLGFVRRDRNQIVAYLRTQRTSWITREEAAKANPKGKVAKAPPVDPSTVSLDDLL